MKRMCVVSHHAQENARGKQNLVKSCKGTTEVNRGHTLDIQRVQAHHQTTEKTKNETAHYKKFKRFSCFA